MSGPSIKLGMGDKATFADTVALTMDGMLEEFRLVASIFLYGWGSGVIGVVDSVAGSVISLKDDIHPIN